MDLPRIQGNGSFSIARNGDSVSFFITLTWFSRILKNALLNLHEDRENSLTFFAQNEIIRVSFGLL